MGYSTAAAGLCGDHRLQNNDLTLFKKETVAVNEQSEDAEVDENVGGDVGGKSKTPEQHLQGRNEPR